MWSAALVGLLLMSAGSTARAQDAAAPAASPHSAAQAAPTTGPKFDIYWVAQADAIVDFEQNNPDWYDVNRPSKLPSFHHEFGEDQHFYLSPRQSYFGVKGTFPTSDGDVTAVFEFDMFGVGPDAGQTTIHLRHAWGQWKQIGAGQTNSEFMDVDVFPNVLDYLGPNGMLFFRNTQVFWEPYKKGDSNIRVAIENPGASGDAGVLSDRIELQNIKGRFPAPDLTGHYRSGQPWGYFQVGGALRYIAYDDLLLTDPFDLSGHNWGWGISGSGAIKRGTSDTLHLQLVYGRGVEDYFDDAPVDVAVEPNPGNAITPVKGEALRDLGLVAYLDHNWSGRWASSIGYSRVSIDNSELQAPLAFRIGEYSSANLLWTPVKNVIMGGEFQWAERRNFSDGFKSHDTRLRFSFKYSFSTSIGSQ